MLKAYRIGDRRYPLFDAGGAQLYGGRWNLPGRRVIYAAESLAGALLEILAHANIGQVPRNHVYIEISIPDELPIKTIERGRIKGWGHPGMKASRKVGDSWHDSGRTLILVVPSVVNQLENNLLINQDHPDFSKLRASRPRQVRWDRRLFDR